MTTEEKRPEVFALVTYEPHEGGRLEGVYTSAQAAQRAAYALEFTPTYAYAHRVQLDAAPERYGPDTEASDGEELDTFCPSCHGEPVLRCLACGSVDCYPYSVPGLVSCTSCGGPETPRTEHVWEGCKRCGRPE